MHICPARRCPRNVQDHLLMCGIHWHQVPADLQAEVWRCYNHGAGLVNGVPTRELVEAQRAAINAVNSRVRA